MIIGIGVNVYNEIPSEIADAANLKMLLSGRIPETDWDHVIEELAAEVYSEISSILSNGIVCADEYLDEIELHCITIGKQVEVPEREISGKAIHIAEDGSLCIQKAEDDYEFVKSGDVMIVKN